MTTEEAKQLISKYIAGQCNEVEKALLDAWYIQLNCSESLLSSNKIEELRDQIYSQLPSPSRTNGKIKLWSVILAVASLSLIAISILIFYQRNETIQKHNKLALDIEPGGNKATITLANGKTINLSSSKAGVSLTSSKLSYIDGTNIEDAADHLENLSGLQSITTPKGGQYQIELPDGTKVWLNAATTLQFPASLKRERGERKVKLIRGEAYFEVYKNKKRPFVVSTGQQDVFVLGTHFNINAYEPDLIKTILLEGSVRVQSDIPTSKIKSKILLPGEQAVNNGGSIRVHKVNTNIELAWKKGKIQFVRSDLKTVMAMISRWYDIEVIYQYYPDGGKFTGSISRSKNISEVLSLLETTGDVRFKIQGRQVFVMK